MGPSLAELEDWASQALKERGALIRHILSLPTEDANILSVREEIMGIMDHIKACLQNTKFRGIVEFLLSTLFEVAKEDMLVLKGPMEGVWLHLQEEEIKVVDLRY